MAWRRALVYRRPVLRGASWSALAVALVLTASGCRGADNFRRLAPQAAITADVPYLTADPRQALDVFAPRTPGPHPVVLFVHGGYWHTQDRRYLPHLTGLYGNVGVALASRGVLTVLPSYRLFPAVGVEGEVEDVLAALAWTIAHAAEHGGDPQRIVLAGHSAGAHLIMVLATEPERLRARGIDPAVIRGQIALSGIYDVPGLLDRADPELRRTVLEGVFAPDPARWSPLDRLDAARAPTLFVVGEHDHLTCRRDLETARAKLRGQPGRGVFLVLEGQTHAEVVLEIGSRRDVLGPKMAEFVRRVSSD